MKQKAFTLIEALLVVSLISLIGLALFHTFSDGMKVWDKSKRLSLEEDIAIFWDKIGYDLQNSFAYSQLPFHGEETRLHFATRVNLLSNDNNQSIQQIGQVEYVFDPARQAVYRRQANYGQALKNNFSTERLLVRQVHSLRFLYYYKEGTDFVFRNKIENTIPRAVSVELEYTDSWGQRSLKKLINLFNGT